MLASHRHLGLGAPLVRFAVSSASRPGGREMEAFIQPANVAFFRWLGWRRTGELVDYAGDPAPAHGHRPERAVGAERAHAAWARMAVIRVRAVAVTGRSRG